MYRAGWFRAVSDPQADSTEPTGIASRAPLQGHDQHAMTVTSAHAR